MTVQIAPSVLSADFMNMGAELERIKSAEFAHVDIMDQNFVPNLTFGLSMVEQIKKVSPIPLDVHLMIEDPDRWAPIYTEAGADLITFHAEAVRGPVRLARECRRLGARAGVALAPGTSLEPFLDILPAFDVILLMTVEPGFGGQPFVEGTLSKIRRLRDAVGRSGQDLWIEIDGGVNAETIERAAEAGADVFVAGSSVFGPGDIEGRIAELRELAERGHAHGHPHWARPA